MTHFHRRLTTALAITALAASMFGAPAQADWGEEALLLQEQLDVNNTVNRTLWVGTHNSYNSSSWDPTSYIDPNQSLTPLDQLRAGARELTYDVHEYLSSLRLCHGDPCGGGEKKFRDGLREIRDFIDEGNENAVILLKLELEDFFGQTATQLEGILDGYIYKPRAGSVSDDDGCSGRHGLEPEFLSKADVLREGKNVVVLYAAGVLDECPPSSFMEWVHVGLEYEADGWKKKLDKPSNETDCEQISDEGKMSRIHDGNTWDNLGGGGANQSFNNKEEVADYMRCGLNIFELFNYAGDATNPPDAARNWYDPEPEDLVWSWETNQPDGGGDCAVITPSEGRFDDYFCLTRLPFACYSAGADAWRLTNDEGTWDEGEETCAAEHGADGYVFAVPTTPVQMHALHQEQGSELVWVDYNDLSIEGVWQANSDFRLSVYDEFGSFGGTGGGAFDQFMLERSLYTNELRTIASVRINGGARVDGFEVTFSDGTSYQRGGTGGSWTESLTLASGEYIDFADVCVDTYSDDGFGNVSDRVYYLKFHTNLGRWISHGTGSGTCTWKYFEHRLYDFYGRDGEELDMIGFYTVDLLDIPTTVIDNGDEGTGGFIFNGTTGNWPTSTYSSGYEGADYAYADGDGGDNSFLWIFTPTYTGTYDVYARWTAHSNRTLAEYTLTTSYSSESGTLETTEKDQTQDGGQDNLLWSQVLLEAGTTYYVRLDSTTGGYVVADSVTFEFVED